MGRELGLVQQSNEQGWHVNEFEGIVDGVMVFNVDLTSCFKVSYSLEIINTIVTIY